MPAWRLASVMLAAFALAACSIGETPERAQILGVRSVPGTTQLEVTQQLHFSEHMREALDYGIPLRLVYRLHWCDQRPVEARILELRYLPLSRDYQLLRVEDGELRRFARSSALFAALDRVRLSTRRAAPDCGGRLRVALDLTSLPTPLRFPAFLEPSQWRLVSPDHVWSTAQP